MVRMLPIPEGLQGAVDKATEIKEVEAEINKAREAVMGTPEYQVFLGHVRRLNKVVYGEEVADVIEGDLPVLPDGIMVPAITGEVPAEKPYRVRRTRGEINKDYVFRLLLTLYRHYKRPIRSEEIYVAGRFASRELVSTTLYELRKSDQPKVDMKIGANRTGLYLPIPP